MSLTAPKNAPLRPYLVSLACGHRIRLHNAPLPGATYGCTNGLGCGYGLRWTHYRIEGTPTIRDNARAEQ